MFKTTIVGAKHIPTKPLVPSKQAFNQLCAGISIKPPNRATSEPFLRSEKDEPLIQIRPEQSRAAEEIGLCVYTCGWVCVFVCARFTVCVCVCVCVCVHVCACSCVFVIWFMYTCQWTWRGDSEEFQFPSKQTVNHWNKNIWITKGSGLSINTTHTHTY